MSDDTKLSASRVGVVEGMEARSGKEGQFTFKVGAKKIHVFRNKKDGDPTQVFTFLAGALGDTRPVIIKGEEYHGNHPQHGAYTSFTGNFAEWAPEGVSTASNGSTGKAGTAGAVPYDNLGARLGMAIKEGVRLVYPNGCDPAKVDAQAILVASRAVYAATVALEKEVRDVPKSSSSDSGGASEEQPIADGAGW